MGNTASIVEPGKFINFNLVDGTKCQVITTNVNMFADLKGGSYDNVAHIDKNIVRVILEHMKCMEQFNFSGAEKKAIVLSSIETIFVNNNSKKDTVGFIVELSSQLIDTFIAFDKDKINITEKKLSSLSCFPCKT